MPLLAKNLKKHLLNISLVCWIPILICLFSCKLLRPNLRSDLDSKSSCLVFDIPPITLTPTRTAAENQLLGRQLELDTTFLTVDTQVDALYYHENKLWDLELEPSTLQNARYSRRYELENGALEYYDELRLRYINESILGEGYDGFLRIVPGKFSSNKNIEKRTLANTILSSINRSRQWLYRYHLFEQQKIKGRELLPEEISPIKNSYLLRYFQEMQKQNGAWVFTKEHKWRIVFLK